MSRATQSSIFLAFALSLFFVLAAPYSSAAPFVVVEEEARLVLGGAGDDLAGAVAIDGDRIVIVTSYIGGGIRRQVHLFERNAFGAWTHTGQLLEIASEFRAPWGERVDIHGNVIAVTFIDELHVLEFVNGSWQHTSLSTPPGIRMMGGEVSIDAGRIVVSAATTHHEALEFRKNTSGVWAFAGRAIGDPLFRDVQWNGFPFNGGDVETAGDSIVLGTPFGSDDPMHDRVIVFRQANGAWIQSQIIERDSAGLTAFIGNVGPGAGTVALGSEMMALVGQRGSNSAGLEYGLGVYTRSGDLWSFHDFAYLPRDPQHPGPPLAHAISGNLIAVAQADGDRSGVTVYRHTSSGVQLAARLHTSLRDMPPLELRAMYRMDISGRTVVASAAGSTWVFTLPENLTAPDYMQDDFQDGNANGWQPLPANAWTVGATTRSRVYRQRSLTGGARTLVSGMDWTNQSIQVDVTPRAFERNDRWFGLIVRYADPNNYYYVTVRDSNELRIRRMLNGEVGDLAFGLYNIELNRPYRLRLEAVGTRIRAYVDDAVMLEAIDDTLTHGAAGLAVYKARADYDNVLVTPNPQQRVRTDDFMRFAAFNWTLNGGQWTFPPDFLPEPGEPDPYEEQRVLQQNLARGGARAIAGPPLDDQRVRARVSATSFANNGWFGLIARHVDDDNHYYLRVAADGHVAIRKLMNGNILELARTTLPIRTNTYYTIELQAVGDRLLAYVNGQFLLQATDSSHNEGRYGVMTYNAAARFDDFLVRQP